MTLINPQDSLERQNAKLIRITEALMRRVEYGDSRTAVGYAQFERAALLEKRVRERTTELESTLDLLHDSNAELSKAHQETENARRNLADAIETVSEGFALFDPDDVLVMCNSRFCRDFNDSVVDLTPGLPFRSYVEQVSRSRFLDLPEGLSASAWAAKRMHRHEDAHALFNVKLTRDRWLQVSEHRTSNGGTVVVQTDVTDLIRTERQERAKLRDSQSRMIRATLDHLNQGVSIFDAGGRLIGWNEKLGTLLNIPARRLHLGASFPGLIEQLGADISFSRGIDRPAFLRWASGPGPRESIAFEVKRDRKILHIFGRGMPDRGFLISCTDVTAEREASQKLFEMNEILEQRVVERTLELEDALSVAERANASKSRFVAAASHDLLQPLSAAKLFIASLTDRAMRDEDLEVLEKAESALSGAEQIIDALLDISKLDSDGLSFDIRPVALQEILGPLGDEMRVKACAKGLDLRVVSSNLLVETDAAYLRRVVQNLMANAIRYTETGRVLVGVRRNGGSARIEVWDTGPGIAEDDQSTIFEEFKRLDPKASANDGLGLGLAIVERACSRLGHPLGLWSEPGRGSCFMVNVPIAGRVTCNPNRPSRPAAPVSLAQSGLIVLLVENDPQMARAVSMLVESWGVSVIEATDAYSALTLLEDIGITPDALLLDYQLGAGPTGTDLYETIQTRYGAIPCCVISAERSPDLRETCRSLGIDLMLKPLDRTKLGHFLNAVAVL